MSEVFPVVTLPVMANSVESLPQVGEQANRAVQRIRAVRWEMFSFFQWALK